MRIEVQVLATINLCGQMQRQWHLEQAVTLFISN